MSVTVDSVGLRYEIEPADTTLYRDVAEMIRRGDIDGSSFGFKVLKEDWLIENGLEIRELLDVELLDVGPVTFPAYTAASSDLASRQAASARAIDQAQIDRERDQREAFLRKLQRIVHAWPRGKRLRKPHLSTCMRCLRYVGCELGFYDTGSS
ncbi:MAG: HK97 family phage prohead protease [Planctomycetales bacterium]|nr:HK97 family phage prohead protease [Planctomycetales bacterium]